MLAGVIVCFGFICALMYISVVSGEGTISVVAVKKTCKPTFIGLHCDASMSWNQISHFFMPSCQCYVWMMCIFTY